MSTVYDTGPTPEPTDREQDFMCYVVERVTSVLIQKFGRQRMEVMLDDWHVSEVAEALCNNWEPGRRRRIMSDLNEAIRCEQVQDGLEGPPWVLVPVREP